MAVSVDLPWHSNPEWWAAIATFGGLIIAVIATYAALRAAHFARCAWLAQEEQVRNGQEQVRMSREELAKAENQLSIAEERRAFDRVQHQNFVEDLARFRRRNSPSFRLELTENRALVIGSPKLGARFVIENGDYFSSDDNLNRLLVERWQTGSCDLRFIITNINPDVQIRLQSSTILGSETKKGGFGIGPMQIFISRNPTGKISSENNPDFWMAHISRNAGKGYKFYDPLTVAIGFETESGQIDIHTYQFMIIDSSIFGFTLLFHMIDPVGLNVAFNKFLDEPNSP